MPASSSQRFQTISSSIFFLGTAGFNHYYLDSVQAKRRTRRRYQETDGWISFYSPSWPSVYQLVTGILFFYLLVVLAKEITPRLEDSAAIQQLFSLFQLGGWSMIKSLSTFLFTLFSSDGCSGKERKWQWTNVLKKRSTVHCPDRYLKASFFLLPSRDKPAGRKWMSYDWRSFRTVLLSHLWIARWPQELEFDCLFFSFSFSSSWLFLGIAEKLIMSQACDSKMMKDSQAIAHSLIKNLPLCSDGQSSYPMKGRQKTALQEQESIRLIVFSFIIILIILEQQWIRDLETAQGLNSCGPMVYLYLLLSSAPQV